MVSSENELGEIPEKSEEWWKESKTCVERKQSASKFVKAIQTERSCWPRTQWNEVRKVAQERREECSKETEMPGVNHFQIQKLK